MRQRGRMKERETVGREMGQGIKILPGKRYRNGFGKCENEATKL